MPTKVHVIKAMGFPVITYGCENWTLKNAGVPKNWCFGIVVLEKILESPLDCKEFKPVNPKGNQSWIFIGMTDTKAEAPILWLPDAKSWLIGKDPDAGKDWRREENGMTENETVREHHWLNGHEFEKILGDSEGQGSLVCCSPCCHRVKHDLVTEQHQSLLQAAWSLETVYRMCFQVWGQYRLLSHQP